MAKGEEALNVFVVSRYPELCAQALDDKRLNKMVLETTQLICTVLNKTYHSRVAPYESVHHNHPITLWAEGLPASLPWLYELGICYGNEIIYRHGRKHASHLVLEGMTFKWPWLTKYRILQEDQFHNGARHRGRGLDFTHLPVRKAYREYLNARWPDDKRKPVWTRRSPPSWKS